MIRWRPIPGFAGYDASDAGEIRNARTLRALRLRPSDSGYLKVRVPVDGRRRVLFVARAVLLAFVGEPTRARRFAAHESGDQIDNRLDNLAWKTQPDNEADKKRHGTVPRIGRRRDPDDATVESIRREAEAGTSFSALGRKYGLHRSSISRIVRGLRRAA